MDIEQVNKIKRLTIIALASDDELEETIVLKGGNAIDLIYRDRFDSASRTSYDLDFSVEREFHRDEEEIKMRIEKTLVNTFREHGYVVIDYKFIRKPKNRNEATAEFWGGYLVTFKVLGHEEYGKLKDNIDAQRRMLLYSGPIIRLFLSWSSANMSMLPEKKRLR